MQKHQQFLNRLANFIKGSNAPENEESFDLLFDYYEKKKNQLTDLSDEEEHGKELFEKISFILEQDNQRSKAGQPKLVRMRPAWWIAASLVFVLMLGGGSYLWVPQVQQSVIAWIQVEKIVPPGGMEQYELPDGTSVWLNAGSKFSYPRFFLGHSREVNLSGEAFFKVARDAQHPFIIHSGNISTRVLGTSFNVKAYGQSNQTIVTVATGRVQVSKNEQVLSTLTANQEIKVDNQSGGYTFTKQVKTNTRLAWRSGRLVFDNTPLEDVFSTLSNHYDVKFELKKVDLKEQFLTTDFGTDASLWQVLDVIIKINKLNFSMNDNMIIVNTQKPN